MKTTYLLTAAAALTALFMVACDPVSGTLQVLRPFSANSGQPNKPCPDYEYPCMDNPVETITVDPGSYRMQLEMFGGHQAQIHLDIGGRQRVLELNIPSGKDLPAEGNFSYSSQETGQPFDLSGQTHTTITDSSETRTQESCEETFQERVCGPQGNPPRYTCWYETHTRPGYQDVAYFYRTTQLDMTASLGQSGSQVAQFTGGRTENDKIYTYKGICYTRGWH